MQGAAIPAGVFLPSVSPRKNPRSDRAIEEAAGPSRGAALERVPGEKNRGGNRQSGQNDGEGKGKSEKSLCENVFGLCIDPQTEGLSGTFLCRIVFRLTKSVCRIIIMF